MDTAHAYGLTVIMDLVHAHCSSDQPGGRNQAGLVLIATVNRRFSRQ